MGCLPDTTFALVGRHKQGGKCFLEKHLQTKVHRAVPSINSVGSTSSAVLSEVQSQDLKKRRLPTKTQKKRSARNKNKTRFRPGTRGECEAQLWIFTGPPGILNDDNAPQLHWVAAESLEAALSYLRQRYDEFTIREARFLSMIPLLSGSPLD